LLVSGNIRMNIFKLLISRRINGWLSIVLANVGHRKEDRLHYHGIDLIFLPDTKVFFRNKYTFPPIVIFSLKFKFIINLIR